MFKSVALCLILFGASMMAARADTFTIDPLQSSLTFSGNYSGNTFSPQSPNSFTTTYSGTIDATIGSSSIKFNSAAAAAADSGIYQPAAGGSAGSAPGDYGGMFNLAGNTTVVFSIRNYVFSLSSATLALIGGNFDASGLAFTVTSGNSDFNVSSGGSGSTSFNGQTATNGSGTGTFSNVGGVETLTIPIDVTITYTTLASNDTTYTLMGSIVATAAAIPEPSTWALLIGGLVVLLACAKCSRVEQ
jgi:hypothetical protein